MRFTLSENGTRYPVIPGQLRDYEVYVGKHTAPDHTKIRAFLEYFQHRYEELIQPTQEGLIAAMAAHHRFVFIHPFGDGNGRVGRLFTTACLIRCGVDADGLWSFSRAMARGRNGGEYKEALAQADNQRVGDLDGRGNLSLRSLEQWVLFALGRCLDQAIFMANFLSLQNLQMRVLGQIELLEHQGELPRGSRSVLLRVLQAGSLRRGEVAKIVGRSSRRAQPVIGELLQKRFLSSPTPKGELYFSIPASSAAAYFPNVYPNGG
jgi:Fic family protein